MNIKPFAQFFQESDEFRLLKDLEDIGVKERTWTRDEIEDALRDLNWAENFEVTIVNEDSFDYDFNERRLEVTAQFTGGFMGEFDLKALWGELSEGLNNTPLNKNVNEDEDLYSLDQIEAAFDNVDWDGMGSEFIENSEPYNSVEIDISGKDQGDGLLSIEAEATFDSDNVEIFEADLINAVLDNL
jgi:hypothetical protein